MASRRRDGTLVVVHLQPLIWLWFVATATCCALVGGVGTGDATLRLIPFLTVMFLVGAGAAGLWAFTARGGPERRRLVWSLFTLAGLPVAFSSLVFVLPAIHPEPYEQRWLALDRALFGFDPLPHMQVRGFGALVGFLHVVYVFFYFFPIVVMSVLALRRRWAAFDRGVVAVAFGFLLSYLGYVLWPTLGPNRLGLWEVREAEPPLGAWLRALIWRIEANPWDCFPSGHTMLTLIAWWIAWREQRWLAWLLAPIALAIVYATMGLCYHYVVDVLAGVVGAVLATMLAGGLQRLSAAPSGPEPGPAQST